MLACASVSPLASASAAGALAMDDTIEINGIVWVRTRTGWTMLDRDKDEEMIDGVLWLNWTFYDTRETPYLTTRGDHVGPSAIRKRVP